MKGFVCMCDNSNMARNTAHLTQWYSLLKGPGGQIAPWLRDVSEMGKR